MQNKNNPKFKSEQRKRTHLQTQYIPQSLTDNILILKFSHDTLESKYYLFTPEKKQNKTENTHQFQGYSLPGCAQGHLLSIYIAEQNYQWTASFITRWRRWGGGRNRQQMCRKLPPTLSIPCPRLTSGICHSLRSC